jgi:DnaJ-domain-containing protein 1
MQIASRLRDTTLGDILAQLHRENATGVLELIEPRARHAIHLRRGYVHAVESESAVLRLGDVAARRWGIGRTLVERARMFAHAKGLRIGHALVATRAIDPSQLDDLLAEQQRARLEMLYDLRDAELRFRVARPLPNGAAEQIPLEARDVYYGRPRKQSRDEARASTERARQPRVSRAHAYHAMAREFALLGVSPESEPSAVRAAFRALVMELHPDRAHGVSDEERDRRARKLVDVVRAYKALTEAA